MKYAVFTYCLGGRCRNSARLSVLPFLARSLTYHSLCMRAMLLTLPFVVISGRRVDCLHGRTCEERRREQGRIPLLERMNAAPSTCTDHYITASGAPDVVRTKRPRPVHRPSTHPGGLTTPPVLRAATGAGSERVERVPVFFVERDQAGSNTGRCLRP